MGADKKYLQQYVDYIKRTGQVPLKTIHFDDDWDPIGPQVRKDLVAAGLTYEKDGGVYLTETSK